MLSLSSSSLVRLPPGKNGIEAGFNAALLAMMARAESGVENVSCAPRVSVSWFAIWVNRELQLPVRVAGEEEKRGLEQSHVLRWNSGY
jgi:hypothetical protein